MTEPLAFQPLTDTEEPLYYERPTLRQIALRGIGDLVGRALYVLIPLAFIGLACVVVYAPFILGGIAIIKFVALRWLAASAIVVAIIRYRKTIQLKRIFAAGTRYCAGRMRSAANATIKAAYLVADAIIDFAIFVDEALSMALGLHKHHRD